MPRAALSRCWGTASFRLPPSSSRDYMRVRGRRVEDHKGNLALDDLRARDVVASFVPHIRGNAERSGALTTKWPKRFPSYVGKRARKRGRTAGWRSLRLTASAHEAFPIEMYDNDIG